MRPFPKSTGVLIDFDGNEWSVRREESFGTVRFHRWGPHGDSAEPFGESDGGYRKVGPIGRAFTGMASLLNEGAAPALEALDAFGGRHPRAAQVIAAAITAPVALWELGKALPSWFQWIRRPR